MKHIYYSISIIFTLLFAGRVQAQNIMKLGNVSVQAGQEATLDISVDNTVPFVAFQVDIPIPDGLTYVASSAVLDDARKEDHTLSASIVAPNTLRLIGYSLGSLQFKGNSGAVAHFKLKAGALPGNYLLTLTNPIIGDATSANILTSSVNGTVTILSPHIQLSVASMDFGRVALLQTSDRNVTITNTGNQPLQVTGITFTNPQFTAIGGSPFTLDANGTKSVTVRFTSQTKGTYKETMSVASNDPAKPITIDTLKAVAFAVNELHAGSMTALSGQTKTLDFTINNMEPFTAFQFDIPLPSTMQYVTGSAALLRTTDHMVSCNLLTGNILRVVAYSPSNTPFTGTGGKVLSLDFKIMGQAGWYPININNGIISDVAGLNAMSQSYNGSLQVSAPQISTVQQLSYGDVSTLSSKTLNLRVYNYGGDVLNINQLTFSDPAFSSAQALPLSIPTGGQYKDIPVTFTKSSKGTVSTTLKINSNDPVKNPFIVNLSANAFAPNYISVKDFNGCPGTDVVVTIDVDNVEDFVALQCDLKYPSCLTPKTTAIVLTDRKGDHSLQSNLLGNNTIRLVAFSMTQQAFKGNTGAVIQIPFTISADAVAGSYPLEISNGILGNAASQNILYSTNNGTIKINGAVGAAGTITGNASVCKGGTETYTVPAITGATSYVWTLPDGVTGTSSTNSITVTVGNTATSGSIKVKGHNGCGDGTESTLAITVNDIPMAAGTITGNTSVCKGGTETYTVPVITGATSYIWTLPTGATGTSSTNTISVTFSSTAISGSVKVKGHGIGGDGTESTLAITVNDIPSAAGAISGNTTVCKGGNETYTVPVITGATSYVWTLPTGVTGSSTTNSITITISSTAITGSIKVKGHNSCGDGTESTLAITVNDIPATAGVITGNTSTYKGLTETYTVPAITGAVTYIWTLPTGVTGTSTSNSITVTISSTAASGNIKVKGHNGCGDGTESSLAITINDVSAGVITGNTSVCKGGTETYTVGNIAGATSYIWTLPAGATGTSTTNLISVTFGTSAVSGNIKVKGHNSGGDGTESTLAITVNDIPSAAGSITGNTTVCKGGTETYTVPAITGATSYVWTLPTGVTGTGSTNSITVTISSSAVNGNIKVKGHNGCGDGAESSLSITVNDPGKNNLTAKGTTGCAGTDVMVTLDVDNGLPFIALQCDLKYPDYLTPKTSEIVLTDRATDHNIQTSLPATNTLRVLAYSLTQQAFKGNSGSVVKIPFTVNSNAVTGSYALELSNVTLGNSQSQNILDNSYNGTMVINALPSTAGIITGNTNICQQTTNITYSVPVIAGATSYIWILPTGATGTSTINTIALNYGSGSVSGNLKVKGHNDCGDGGEASLPITVCLSVGIQDESLANKVEVFPNPTKDIFYVKINKPFENDFKVEVCNSFGQVMQRVIKKKGDNKFSVDLTSYPKGIYFITFSNAEAHFNCKIVKQ